MAKVTLPLLSAGARGTVSDSIVFFPWKGTAVVRGWKKPSNTKTVLQGNARQSTGGAGRAAALVSRDTTYYARLIAKELIPAGQTQQSYVSSEIVSRFCHDAAAFDALAGEMISGPNEGNFMAIAAGLGLVTFSLSYAETFMPFTAELQAYALGKLGCDLQLGYPPYTTPITEWTLDDVNHLGNDLGGSFGS